MQFGYLLCVFGNASALLMGQAKTTSTTFDDVDLYLSRASKAIESRDLDESVRRVDELAAALQRLLKARDTPRSILERTERLVETTPAARSQEINNLAFLSVLAEDYEKAEFYAREAIDGTKPGAPRRLQNVFYGNQVLGLVSLARGDTLGAVRYLFASLEHGSWQAFQIVGPNTLLASRLLAIGEKKAVLEFFELCKPLWPNGVATLNEWQNIIRAGAKPDLYRSERIRP